MPAALDQVFKAYDVRGVYPDQLDEELAERVGRAFVALTGAKTLAIGQDMRPSSKPMADALAAGAMAQGADVLRVGLCSTDMLYYVSGALDVAGVMLTASHNPARYNGLKLCRPGALPVGEESGLADIKRMVAAGEPAADAGHRGRERQADDLLDRYAAHVRSFVDPGTLRPLKVVADAGNGMAGHVVPAAFQGLPFELVSMYFELDGSFPNHPADPLNPENLRALQARVVAEGADVGLAFDGDADRVFLVDEQGATVPSSLVGALVARLMCEREPGATVLYNLICSRVVPETIREAGGVPVRTRVGHSFIKGVMAETGAIFGCEHSGHYYFRDNYRADSGLIAALVALEALSRAGRPLSQVLAPYRRYAASGEINRRVDGDPNQVILAVARRYPPEAADFMDGLTVEAGDWWFNLRPSNTEPLLRLNVEAASEAEMARVRDEVLELVGGEPA
ncbi:MAG TPA: phosphomannomutase/phosphoglucomutase [Actinomycetes bacterium]|nr:phosphomannomutase/phosphoglucomutase [Actinomycetes bacterium]